MDSFESKSTHRKLIKYLCYFGEIGLIYVLSTSQQISHDASNIKHVTSGVAGAELSVRKQKEQNLNFCINNINYQDKLFMSESLMNIIVVSVIISFIIIAIIIIIITFISIIVLVITGAQRLSCNTSNLQVTWLYESCHDIFQSKAANSGNLLHVYYIRA